MMLSKRIVNRFKREVSAIQGIKLYGYKKYSNLKRYQRFVSFSKATHQPVVLPYIPPKLSVYITRNCNQRCNHCIWLIQDPNYFDRDHDISIGNLKEILEKCKECATSLSIVSDGEVFMHKHFEEVINTARQMSFSRFSTTTNGLLMDQHLDTLVNHFKKVTVSLDGFDPASYKFMRNGGEKIFEKVMNNISLLIEKRKNTANSSLTDITVNAVIGNQNRQTMIPIIRTGERLGVDRVRFNNFNTEGEQDTLLSPMRFSDPEVKKYYKQIVDEGPYKIDISLPPLKVDSSYFTCGILFSGLMVNANGDLSPCCHIQTDKKYGNLKTDRDAWNSPGLVEFRTKFRKATKTEELPKNCQSCYRLGPNLRISYSAKNNKWRNMDRLFAIC